MLGIDGDQLDRAGILVTVAARINLDAAKSVDAAKGSAPQERIPRCTVDMIFSEETLFLVKLKPIVYVEQSAPPLFGKRISD